VSQKAIVIETYIEFLH